MTTHDLNYSTHPQDPDYKSLSPRMRAALRVLLGPPIPTVQAVPMVGTQGRRGRSCSCERGVERPRRSPRAVRCLYRCSDLSTPAAIWDVASRRMYVPIDEEADEEGIA